MAVLIIFCVAIPQVYGGATLLLVVQKGTALAKKVFGSDVTSAMSKIYGKTSCACKNAAEEAMSSNDRIVVKTACKFARRLCGKHTLRAAPLLVRSHPAREAPASAELPLQGGS
jgi:hypothetical protein